MNPRTMILISVAAVLCMFFFGVKPLAAHDALNDTINTVKVLRNLSFLRGIQDQMGYCALEAV